MKWYSRLLGVFLFVVFVLPSHAAVADDWSFAVSVLPSAALAAPSQPKIEVVCFSANNCAPCKKWVATEQPRLEAMGRAVRVVDGTDVKYRKPWSVVNSEGKRFTVQPVTAYPTVMIFNDGVPVWRQTGYAAASEVAQHIQGGS